MLLLLSTLTLTAQAQSEPRIRNLLIELWPEFDRPELLVIYRVELSSDTPLPATLTFSLPGSIDTMNAVAYGADNNLLTVEKDQIDMTYRDNMMFLTFSTPSPLVQLEYYDSEAITRQDQTRTFDYTFTAPYAVESAIFQVQQPAQAEAFSLKPETSNSFIDSNRLTYHVIEQANIAAGETVSVIATYQRPTEALTFELLTPVSEHAEDIIPVSTEPPQDSNVTIAYALTGIGAVLILAAAGHWWWTKSKSQSGPARRRPPRTGRRASQTGSTQSQANRAEEPESAGFCYNCGAALRADSHFCHKCGTKRRE
ncbi:MAG: zinc ribbon domain-containing protein [Anaerolineae bacterium]|nr:zinc ribbon domain-containing protein [Anaerolineae bacterium]